MRTPLKTLVKFDDRNLESLNSTLLGIWRALNQGIEFGSVGTGPENMYCDIKTFTSPVTADTEFSVGHNLRKVPTGYWIVKQSQVCGIYDGTTQNTDALLYLKCDTESASGTVIII